jgi:hypothetical protein
MGDVSNDSIVITTRKEYSDNNHVIDRVVFEDELEGDPAVIKAKIVKMLNTEGESTLLIGIDPGKRIGLTVIYMHDEIDSRVLTSIDSTVDTVYRLVRDINADRCIIKIGYGDPNRARHVANMLHLLMDNVTIEFVDEHGTSSCIETNKRSVRDKLSARVIALRKGTPFRPEL